MRCLRAVVLIVCVSGLVAPLWAASTPASTNYVAGVVEFSRESVSISFTEDTRKHIEAYETILKLNTNASHDIVVFPEGTLNTPANPIFMPADLTTNNAIPCELTGFDDLLRRLSCAARNSTTYLVVQLYEKVDCNAITNTSQSCPPNGVFTFSTVLAIDREGRVPARHRKFHLGIGDSELTTTSTPISTNFTTDFGVTFGLLTGTELHYFFPAIRTLELGVHDFACPSAEPSEIPFLTSVQLHQGWAQGRNVNLLVAGANSAANGMSGTGIYSGRRGALVQVLHGLSSRDFYSAIVPKNTSTEVYPEAQRIRDSNSIHNIMFQRESMAQYQTMPLNFVQPVINATMCFDDLCCSFSAEALVVQKPNVTQFYNYRFAIGNSFRKFGMVNDQFASCALIACNGDTLESCSPMQSDVIQSNVVFNNMTIQGWFRSVYYGATYMPSTQDEKLLALHSDDFVFNEAEQEFRNGQWRKNITISLQKSQNSLRTFGIYYREFNSETMFMDWPMSAAADLKFSGLLFAVANIVIYLLK